jgi:hypothetical protein
VERKCQSLVESHSQVFNLRKPWHFLAVKYNFSARKSPWRPASSEINCLCFRSVHFYLPLFEVFRQWVEIRLKPIADIHLNWTQILQCHLWIFANSHPPYKYISILGTPSPPGAFPFFSFLIMFLISRGDVYEVESSLNTSLYRAEQLSWIEAY